MLIHIYIKRDPDLYQFHIMTLPTELVEPPHSEDSKDVVIDTVENGRVVQGKKKKELL